MNTFDKALASYLKLPQPVRDVIHKVCADIPEAEREDKTALILVGAMIYHECTVAKKKPSDSVLK